MKVSRTMRSYAMQGFGEPLVERIEAAPAPTGSEVLMRVDACGVCHSDLHIWEGGFDLGGGKRLDFRPFVTLPHTLGHEIAGTVIACGPEAQGVAAGERRVVYPWIGCGRCARCTEGDEHLCAAPAALGTRRRGGFSDTVLVPHARYLFDFAGVREEFACTCACSGLTAFSALKKAAPQSGGAPLLIVGAGGVGLAAIRLACSVHGVAPIVAEVDRNKWDAARAAGASRLVDPHDTDAVKALMDESGGVAAAIDFVGAPASASFAMGMLRKGGRLVLVGLFGGSIELALPLLPLRAISLIGSFVGSLAEMQELMALVRAGRVQEIPLQVQPLALAQQTLDQLKQGRVIGRVVLQP
jgi:alcohol dehydrogenase/propanol-preferring alcohol dehydrogenase